MRTIFSLHELKEQMNETNTRLEVTSEASSLPRQIVTHGRRFSSGLWRVFDGGIASPWHTGTFRVLKVIYMQPIAAGPAHEWRRGTDTKTDTKRVKNSIVEL